MASKDPSVLVIGAGLAGLAAGCHLIKGGLANVTVLEAGDRIGGRIHSVQFGNEGESEDPPTVELGATWIHGKGPVNELAEAFNLIDNGQTDDEYYGMYVGSNGTKCNEELVRKAKEEFRKIMEELYEKKKSASSLSPYTSALQYIQYRLDQMVKTLPDNDRGEFMDICRTLIKVEEENHGAALEDVSVLIPDDITPGNNISLIGGYSTIISRLAHTVTHKRIHLKTKVISIDYNNPDEVNVMCESEKGAITYTADHVIVTISLGVLKKDHQILFNPGLPFNKIASISKLGYGTASKVILYYKTPFWRKDEGMKLVWRKDTIESNRDLPRWAKCLYTLNSMANRPNTLDVWLCGEEGKEIESIPDEVIAHVLTMVLRQFLNDQTIPEPDLILKTTWASNPQFRGSYSYIQVGSTVEDVRILAAPLVAKDNKPVVLFAGEATDVDYLATTHGSLISGIREADRLLTRHVETVISPLNHCNSNHFLK